MAAKQPGENESVEGLMSEDGSCSNLSIHSLGSGRGNNASPFEEDIDSDSDSTYDDATFDESAMNGSVDSLITKHGQYKQELAHQRQQHETEKAFRETEFAEERSHWQEELQRERATTADWAEKNARKDTDLADLRTKLTKEHADNMDTVKRQCDEKLHEEQVQFDEKLRTELDRKDRAIEQLENSGIEETLALKTKLRTANENVSTVKYERQHAVNKEAELSRVLEEKNKEIAHARGRLCEMDEKHISDLERLTNDYQRQREQELRRVKDDMSDINQRLEADFEREKESHGLLRQVLARNAEVSPDTTLKNVGDAFAYMEKDMKREWEGKEARYEERVKELQDMVEEARVARHEDLEHKFQRDLELVNARHASETDHLVKQNEQIEAKLRRLKESSAKKFAKLRKDHLQEKEMFIKDREGLRQSLEQNREDFKECQISFEAKEALCEQQEVTMEKLTKDLEIDRETGRSLAAQNETEKKELQTRYKDANVLKEQEINDLLAAHEQKVRQMVDEATARHEENQAEKEELEAKHRLAIEAQKQFFEAKFQEVKQINEDAMKQVKEDAQSREQIMKDNHDRLVQYLNDEIRDLQMQRKEIGDRLEREKDARRSDLAEARESEGRKLEEAQVKKEREITKVRESERTERDQLRADYDKKLRDKESTIRELNDKLVEEVEHHAQLIQEEREKMEKSKYEAVQVVTEKMAKSDQESRELRMKKDERINELERENFRLKSLIPPEKPETKTRRFSLSSLGSLKKKGRRGSKSSLQDNALNGTSQLFEGHHIGNDSTPGLKGAHE